MRNAILAASIAIPCAFTDKDSPMPRLHHLIAACLTSCLLAACASSSGGLSTRDADKAYINASIGPVNHTSQYLYGFTINGAFGANARAYAWRNAGTCCVRLPASGGRV